MIQTMNLPDSLQPSILNENTFTSADDRPTADEKTNEKPNKKPQKRQTPNKTQTVAKSSGSMDKIAKTQDKRYNDFISSHYSSGDNTKPITNTRIGGGKTNPDIKGGSFCISDEEYPEFLKLYANSVIKNNRLEFLTEKQLDAKCPILVDIDFRFSLDLESRFYSSEHIQDMILVYQAQLKNIFQFDENSEFSVYIFEKTEVNKIPEKNVTKDGIHMIIGIQMSHAAQLHLRTMAMEGLKEIWADFPLINSWEDVLDKGISEGHTNWQLYGSRKPNHEPYKLTYIYKLKYDANDGEFEMDSIPLETFDVIENIDKLSARYANHPLFYYKSDFIDILEKKTGSTGTLQRRVNSVLPLIDSFAYPQIKNKEDLDKALQAFLDSIGTTEYELREAYDYAMILPAQYYEEGSYSKWIRVGIVLKRISSRLYVVWIAFSAKAARFDYGSIPDLYEMWIKFDINHPNGLTKYSLIHWAKIDGNHDEFIKIRDNTVDYYVDLTLNNKDSDKKGGTDYDIAVVLHQLFKDEFKCVSVKANIWYQYKKHKWSEVDSGTTLRNAISTTLRSIYSKKGMKIFAQTLVNESLETTTEEEEKIKKIKNSKMSKIDDILRRLGTTNDKKNIMTEAKELFYDGQFLEKLDVNPYLLCCNNGVIDFKEKVFRRGYPEDHLSKTTKIDYIPIQPSTHQITVDKIHDFMRKLFPIPELCSYMWQHLASTLIGTCADQTFNMYIGVGRNGKSVLITLMEMVLGNYKGDVPLSLVTDRRTKIGGLAPELVALKGVRYAVMQEPSKGDKLNEGVMKQITGGDDVQARAPYMPESITFKPQFKLVVCSNQFMEIKSQDGGTWRRIRVVDFMSIFCENPVQGDKDKPYQYLLDKDMKQKFNEWKEIFLSMLIAKAFETDGKVDDCPIVMKSSESYKESQDFIAEFMGDRIIADPKGRITKGDVNCEFCSWYEANYGKKDKPNVKDVHAEIDKKFGKYDKMKKAWIGIRMTYESDVSEETDGEDEIPDVDI